MILGIWLHFLIGPGDSVMSQPPLLTNHQLNNIQEQDGGNLQSF